MTEIVWTDLWTIGSMDRAYRKIGPRRSLILKVNLGLLRAGVTSGIALATRHVTHSVSRVIYID